jgi:hypothetical protein
MMDVLYGEEVAPRLCFEFFQHLSDCSQCRQEYRELLDTRELLAEWETEDDYTGSVRVPQRAGFPPKILRQLQWWPLLQKVAATVLILVGAVSLLQTIGLGPQKAGVVSDKQLTEILHDVTVARQVEDWRVIGKALLSMKEDLEDQDRLHIQAVYEDIHVVEQRFVQALEESNRNVRTLMGN